MQSKNWYDARKFCLAHEAHLVDIDSTEENNFVLNLAKGRVGQFWTGLNDRVEESHFVRSDGSAPRFLNWYDGEPNDLGGEDCVEVIMGYSNGKPFNGQWNDRRCWYRQAFICEKTHGELLSLQNISNSHT